MLVQGEKMWMQRKRKGCSRSLSNPPLSLRFLSYLRLQASRPLQQRPWSTTPPAWSSHIPPDYNIESRKMSRWRGGKKTKNSTAEMMAKIESESAKHLMMRVLSSHPLSKYLSPSQLRPTPLLRIWICTSEWWKMNHNVDIWRIWSIQAFQEGNSDQRASAHRGCTAPQGCAGAYGCMDGVVCVYRLCESAVCGNEGMGKRTEMRWVCGDEDTWDLGTLPHPEQPPPPVAMQPCVGRRYDSPRCWGARPRMNAKTSWQIQTLSTSSLMFLTDSLLFLWQPTQTL